MSGTREGGLRAAKTNTARYGKDFYAKIGQKGGQKGTTGGFAANPELARKAGAKGGSHSSRGIPRLLVVGDTTYPFETVKEASQFASNKFGVRSAKYVDGDKVLTLNNGQEAIIVKDE